MPLFALLGLAVVLHMTNPLYTGPLSILAVFVLIYLLILSTLCVVLRLLAAVIRLVKPQYQFPLRRGYYALSVVSLAPVLLIALNTLGQLDILECTLILLLVGLGCFYVLRRTAK